MYDFVNFDVTVAQVLAHEYAQRYTALPVQRAGDILYIAMSDPTCFQTCADLQALTGCFIEPLLARASEIRYYIHQAYGSEAVHSIASQFIVEEKLQHRRADAALLAELNNAPAVRLLDNLIEAGVTRRASDLHIEPFEQFLRARIRVDGVLHTHATVDISLLPMVISRLKIMADMDIAERRLPQDGHFACPVSGEMVDFRVATMPTLFGEKAVLRLLYDGRHRIRKADLGFDEKDMAALTRLFQLPYGVVIITGPTGSGKSTTMSAFLEELNATERNIMTVENPVENPLPGVNHTNAAAGFDFADALKHMLRQDPDVIMVGEIRDTETARTAIQAALTGHGVLTTLHTNDAAGVVERLADMGVENFKIAAALNGVISQRLVRSICPDCRRPAALTPEQAALLSIDPATPVSIGSGCKNCHHTGFRGRFAIYEYFIVTEPDRRLLTDQPQAFTRAIRARKGLRKNALRALALGRTTAGEIIRALHRDL